MTPRGCVGDSLNAVSGPPVYDVICSGFSFKLWKSSSYIMSHELPSSIKIRETSQLAIIASIKRGSSSLVVSSTSLWSPKPKIGLLADFGVALVVLHLTMPNDSCGMTPPKMVPMVGCCSYLSIGT
ncbi:hypothetical protein A2U01_0012571 [Trifolium medium]|uniref:Uncharacterized protein n=1 Tax=Trifolium medium TaxID=97028 RepID=A0A392MWG4_9FABA|nr:hypothetical protein [Trifolium medium]